MIMTTTKKYIKLYNAVYDWLFYVLCLTKSENTVPNRQCNYR